jgi:hypothetical protein
MLVNQVGQRTKTGGHKGEGRTGVIVNSLIKDKNKDLQGKAAL